ncbi:DUF2624 family protein [Gracilibacillus sp. S3-1-1]|uniref:DUF2624 family protein n=1 Tax=Gracilibacillus pellucidus TaxID=3095368 RepID=A0ACC6M4Z0_9BACI|nr:DUF2624 family protein [Gracilibacillus sp. S3-1-1]MDX8045968.1 DUF2624 family protein [Gracilibacillus sp. S3-1-1]
MNGIAKHFIKGKLRSLNASDIVEYAHQYNISISDNQANQIADHLKKSKYDPTNADDRMQMLRKLAQITDAKTAKSCQQLFNKLIKEYGVEHYFR